MTVTLDHLPQHRLPASPLDLRMQHRQNEAARRRQEALARLARRRMPLPGQPTGDDPQRPKRLRVAPVVIPADDPPARGDFTLVPGATNSDDSGCECGTSVSAERPVLTEREIEVLRAWLMLDTKPAVAQELFISLGTVNTHLTRIRAKYSEVGRPAPTKAALVARAVQDGLISLGEL